MVLAQVAPPHRPQFSNHPTQVVTIPLTPPMSLGNSSSSLLVDSFNVNQYGCGGMRLRSMGASLHRSFLIRGGLIVFIPRDTYRHVEPSTFTAPSQEALPSPSLQVRFLLTMSQELASIGLSISIVGPISSSSRTTIQELELAVMLITLLHLL